MQQSQTTEWDPSLSESQTSLLEFSPKPVLPSCTGPTVAAGICRAELPLSLPAVALPLQTGASWFPYNTR